MIPSVMKWVAFIQKYFGIFFLAAMTLGLLFPGVFSVFGNYVIILLSIIMVLSFLGIDFSMLLSNVKKVHLVLVAFLIFKIALPGVLYYVAGVFFDTTITVTILLLNLTPLAIITAAITGICKGDDTFVLLLMVLSTLLSPLYLPLVMDLVAGREVALDIPAMIRTLLFLVIVPFLGAFLIRRFAQGFVRASKEYYPAVSIFFVMLLLSGIMGDGAEFIYQHPDTVLEFLLIGYGLGVILGLLGLSGLFLFSREKRIGLAVGILYMNLGLSIVIAKTFLSEEAVLFCVLYEFPANTLPMALFFLRKRGVV